MKELRKVRVHFKTPDPLCWDKKSGEEVDLSTLPRTVRQWFMWDENVVIEVDVVTGEAKVIQEEETEWQ